MSIRSEEEVKAIYAAHPNMRTEEEIEAFLKDLPLTEFQRRCGQLTGAEMEVAEWIWGGRVHHAYWNQGEMATIAEETRHNYIREGIGLRAIK
jgi:hypothetical protein